MGENQQTLELESMEQEQLQFDEFTYNPIDLDISNVTGCKYDKKAFQEGVNSVSKVAGIITALKNTGLPWNLVMDYVFNSETMAFNLELADKNNATSIAMSKNQSVNVEKTQL